MQDRIAQRLLELQTQSQDGQQRLAALEQQKQALVQQLVEVQGAIRVLKELTTDKTVVDAVPVPPGE